MTTAVQMAAPIRNILDTSPYTLRNEEAGVGGVNVNYNLNVRQSCNLRLHHIHEVHNAVLRNRDFPSNPE
jgi:hypothetical protein